jgi:large exoprotein involved in heme utilization and adhesion
MNRQGFGRSLTLITLTQACSISLCCFGPLTPARGQIIRDRTLGAVGRGGDVNITTGSLFLTKGALVSASTFGQGDAGNVTITARDSIAFDGVGNNGFASGAFSTVGLRAVGNGGNVN